MTKRICLYHRADFDGHCSGAIVKNQYPECTMYGIDYGDEVTEEMIEYFFHFDTLIIVDFCFNDFKHMIRLHNKLLDKMLWIDHHATAMKRYHEALETNKLREGIRGIREIGTAACELCWRFFRGSPLPETVKLLGRYDVWDHRDLNVVPFQYGLRTEKYTHPLNQELWSELFTKPHESINRYVEVGDIILEYQKKQNGILCSNAIRTTFEGYKCLLTNGGFGSKVFDDVSNRDDFPIVGTFYLTKTLKWKVSLYTDAESDVDVGALCAKYGGGGHKGAGGFYSTEDTLFKDEPITPNDLTYFTIPYKETD